MKKVDLGQVFTPKVISDYMVGLFTLKADSKILDPCFGEGALIDSLCNKSTYSIYGIELDTELYNMLNTDKYTNRCKLYNENFLEISEEQKFDGIIMNPPYIRQEKIDELKQYGINKNKLLNQETFCKLSKKSNMYMYFIIKAMKLLKDDGELVVIFPSTWGKSQSGKIFYNELIKEGSIEIKVNIKGNVFGSKATVDVTILKIIKGKLNGKFREENIEYKNDKIKTINKHKQLIQDSNHVELIYYSKIRRGLTTGNNKFFINEFSKNNDFKEYTERILSSPKNIEGYSTKDSVTDELLVIKKDFNDLPCKIKLYIDKERENILSNHKPMTIENKIINKKPWYKLKTYSSIGIIFSYIIREKMRFIINELDINIRDNFYIIYPNINKYLLFALLNNYYTYSRLEAKGKKYGGGILKLQKYDLEDLKVVNIESISNRDLEKIEKMSKKLIDTGDENVVEDITEILSKYEKTSYEEIKRIYLSEKRNRLMKGENDEL